MMMKLQTEVYYRRMVFASGDHADAAKHPKLVIVYTNNASIVEYSSVFSLFPNPCQNQLVLSSDNGEVLSNIEGIEIYDVQGSLVSSPQYTSGTIDVSILNSGIYILKINYGLKSEYVRFSKT